MFNLQKYHKAGQILIRFCFKLFTSDSNVMTSNMTSRQNKFFDFSVGAIQDWNSQK